MDCIANILSRFANSFDLKDWQGLRGVLADSIDIDYSDLRGKRESVRNTEYVALRESSLQHLNTHHLLSNIDIQVKGNTANCTASAMIFRTLNSETLNSEYFNSHVIYRFGLTKTDLGWRISSIKQSVLWSEGNASIHSGVKSKTN